MERNKELDDFIESGIQDYHKKILERLRKLKLSNILKRKNPYLFRVKNLNTSHELVKSILDAHLSSQEEGIFGGFLEELAIYICNETYGGIKSSAEGIDLEYSTDGVRYIVSIKSGPNWGNSSQIAKMKDHFRKAKRILGTNSGKPTPVIAINGCCYGKDNVPEKEEYNKLCGEKFWTAISGDEELYKQLIVPLGYRAEERNSNFNDEYANVLNKFTMEFSQTYCTEEGAIDWAKLLEFNSGY
ncbi:cytosolic protein [Vibrio splendidus]|uniref:PmeII family type II restriction endonuclease n=1 Tax=Vibrio TaxID=662 RepID=UPI000C82D244|nr:MULTISPECIES: PmeII family type II restriction endonuclease [Vibrio]MCC4854484.1 hypothetical protein [Vibrio lentus]MCC5515786.1 cytosolic protein [Vibrio splendidus]